MQLTGAPEDEHVLVQFGLIVQVLERVIWRTVKKKATVAEDVACCLSVPLKWSRIAITIIEIPKSSEPHIISFLRPIRSTNRAGMEDLTANIVSVKAFHEFSIALLK